MYLKFLNEGCSKNLQMAALVHLKFNFLSILVKKTMISMQLLLGGRLAMNSISIHKTMCMEDLSVCNYVNNNCMEEVSIKGYNKFP